MFTGIIQHKGQVEKFIRNTLVIRLPSINVKLGDSVAVNGICLTVVNKKSLGKSLLLTFEISEETLEKTTLPKWIPGMTVNMEPAMTLNDPLGGHWVQGHVDGVGKIKSIQLQRHSREMWIEIPKSLIQYIVPKGSVTIDGVSLTAVKVGKNNFSIALIPHTWKNTNLGELKRGQSVNLETDIMAKYVQKYMQRK
ncbi:MAG: Riboflavin synthase [Elusimicrobia bacterium]|nr:Riboflavin synthase [Elusimicrobiota bacterium]